MGTNYYLHELACDKCGRSDEPLHIGKSSAGWCFSLHIEPDMGLRDLPDWVERWSKPNALIKDEYGETVTPERMHSIITERSLDNTKQWWIGYESERDFHIRNHSEKGPKGLLRHRIGPYCLSHGAGTWDCLTGEFS